MPRRAFWQSPLVMRGTSILWLCDGADALPVITAVAVARTVVAAAEAYTVRTLEGKKRNKD